MSLELIVIVPTVLEDAVVYKFTVYEDAVEDLDPAPHCAYLA